MPKPYLSILVILPLLFAPSVSQADKAAAPENGPLLWAPGTEFLERHWPESIPPQGPPPSGFTELETSLAPAACGSCHPQQYEDWQTSLHSKAMGPGVYGQLIDSVDNDPGWVEACQRCHAPLAEQQKRGPLPSPAGEERWIANPGFDAELQQGGLVCAACHLRKRRYFGPPRREGALPPDPAETRIPHNGFTPEEAFRRSTFCRGCHQFAPDGYALNGKLLENTYNEWRESGYPEQEIHCQDCHMPDRRHLWRGIHDPEITKKGVTITLQLPKVKVGKGEMLEAGITLANTGTGHHFPTYLTPKVFVRARLIDQAGNAVEGTGQEAVIGRESTLDLAEELYDTRIPSGDSLTVTYRERVPEERLRLRVEITVEPDHFYARFYRAVLENGASGRGRALLEQALRQAEASPYTLYEAVIPLGSLSERAGVND